MSALNELSVAISTRYCLAIGAGAHDNAIPRPFLTVWIPEGVAMWRVMYCHSDHGPPTSTIPDRKWARTRHFQTPVPAKAIGVNAVDHVLNDSFVPLTCSTWTS